MGDWLNELSDEERSSWEDFVDRFRRDALQKIDESAFVASLVPGEFDVKFAAELGTAIMLNKPIVAILMPGSTATEKLRLVADEIVEADIDTEDGRRAVAEALKRMVPR